MVKIANLILDEKFIDGIIASHEITKIDGIYHDYLFVNENIDYNFKYIKNNDCIKIISSQKILTYLNKNNYKAVFIHSLFSFPIKLVSEINNKIKVFWFAWGYDIYELPQQKPFIPINLYHNRTFEIINNKSKKYCNIIQRLYNYFKEYHNLRYYHKALKRIDYFSGIIPSEYSLILKYNKRFTAKQVQYSYVNKDFFSSLNKEEINIKGNNILIGNSADPTNNHIDIFEHLKQYNLDNRKIVVPLSYSGNIGYIDKVCSYGEIIFKDNFTSILTFMPYTKYISLINSCSVAIFFHERQQALGNIIACITNGCKVFLSKTSPLYIYLKDQNLIVYSIQEHLKQKEIDTKLSSKEIYHNKSILKKIYGEETYIKNIKDIYKLIRE